MGILTKEELAVILGLSPITVSRWGRSGKIPCLKLSGRVVRYDLKAVEAAIKGGTPANRSVSV